MDYKEANKIVFETNLENLIESKGINIDHIRFIKN